MGVKIKAGTRFPLPIEFEDENFSTISSIEFLFKQTEKGETIKTALWVRDDSVIVSDDQGAEWHIPIGSGEAGDLVVSDERGEGWHFPVGDGSQGEPGLTDGEGNTWHFTTDSGGAQSRDAELVPGTQTINVIFTMDDSYLFRQEDIFFCDTRIHYDWTDNNPYTPVLQLRMSKTLFAKGEEVH